MPTFGRGILFACFWSQIATESERCFFWSRFNPLFSRALEQFSRFRDRNPFWSRKSWARKRTYYCLKQSAYICIALICSIDTAGCTDLQAPDDYPRRWWVVCGHRLIGLICGTLCSPSVDYTVLVSESTLWTQIRLIGWSVIWTFLWLGALVRAVRAN